MENYEGTNQESQVETSTEQELSHSDKMIGVFTEPAVTFEKVSNFPARTVDWALPMFILLVLVALSQILMMSNSEISFQMKEKARQNIEKSFADAVKNGQMTQSQADEQIDKIMDQMEQGRGAIGMVIQTVSIFVIGFIFFFIISAIYFFFSKIVLKGSGSYSSALVASGLTSYISMIQIILAAILALVFGKLMSDISIATFISADKSTITGWFLAKLDPISIWAYIVVGIGLAKMFRSKSTINYIIMVLLVWILGSLIFFAISKAVPFLSFLNG
ncbi:MAG TPA: YIP1 family protein [Ignavibacteriaceae bacterium]|nr:YIP1 family protein [Ignavibacteriaceae bacterium]